MIVMWSFFSYFLCLLSDAVLDKSSSLRPHGTPYGIKLVKCPAWVAATLSGSFNKGVIYVQRGGLTAFSDSHVSVWTEPRTGQRDSKQSGLDWTKIYLVTDTDCVLKVVISLIRSFKMAAGCCSSHAHSSGLQVFWKGAVHWNAV